MKPSWKDAPEWAQWLAMDADGYWWWYENKPWKMRSSFARNNGRATIALEPVSRWQAPLEPRP